MVSFSIIIYNIQICLDTKTEAVHVILMKLKLSVITYAGQEWIHEGKEQEEEGQGNLGDEGVWQQGHPEEMQMTTVSILWTQDRGHKTSSETLIL